MLNITPDIKIKGHLVLGDQQLLDEKNIFRKYHHIFSVTPTVDFLGLAIPFGSKRDVELDDEGDAEKHLRKTLADTFKPGVKPNFTDAAAALVLAHVSTVAQGSMIARDAALTACANDVKKAFARNFGEQTANKIEYAAGIEFLEYARALPDLREARLKSTFAYK